VHGVGPEAAAFAFAFAFFNSHLAIESNTLIYLFIIYLKPGFFGVRSR
jgi:hypothetical protein